jgi:SPP1 gp7 family putative phage head morphogenesis protein
VKRENWRPSRRADLEYARALWGGFERFFEAAKASPLGVTLLNSAEFLAAYARQAALRMITGLYFQGAKTWREAARESMHGGLIYAALQRELRGPVGRKVRELVDANAELISSFPSKVAAQVAARAAARQQWAGGRAEELLRSPAFQGIVRSRARLVARTEIGKASAALTEARAENLGLSYYVWETSQDERVRFSHRKMQGVVVPFADPPSPEALAGLKPVGNYGPSGIWNCRCYAAPVVRAELLDWPRKVYWSGRVQYMTLSRFRKVSGYPREVAA